MHLVFRDVPPVQTVPRQASSSFMNVVMKITERKEEIERMKQCEKKGKDGEDRLTRHNRHLQVRIYSQSGYQI